MHITDIQGTGLVTCDVIVEDFESITSLQFEISWDTTKMEYMGVNTNLDYLFYNDPILTPLLGNKAFFVFDDPYLYGVDKPDGTSIATFTFNVINLDPTMVVFSYEQLKVEYGYYDGNFGIGIAKTINGMVNAISKQLHGIVFVDENQSCLFENESPLLNKDLLMNVGFANIFIPTDDDGQYQINVCEGSYELFFDEIRIYERICEGEVLPIEIDQEDQEVNVPYVVLYDCPHPVLQMVNEYWWELGPCRPHSIEIRVFNYGINDFPDDQQFFCTVELSPIFEFVDSSPVLIEQDGNSYYFEMENHGSQTYELSISVEPDCDSYFGQPICLSAKLTPDTLCHPDAIPMHTVNFCDPDYFEYDGSVNFNEPEGKTKDEKDENSASLTGGSVEYEVQGVGGVSLSEKMEHTLTISPNPTTNFLNVIVAGGEYPQERVQLSFFNTVGQKVHSSSCKSGNNKIDISTFQSGVYWLRATDLKNNEVHVESVLIQ